MKIKISNKKYYSRHESEIEKYLVRNSTLNIVNIKSIDKYKLIDSDNLILDLEDEFFISKINLPNKYSTLIVTDIFENINNIDLFIEKCKDLLVPNGKLVLSVLNTKYIYLMKLFEYLNFKDKNVSNSFLNNKNISRIVSGYGFEFIKTYSRQLIPFHGLYLLNIINKFFEIFLRPFNLGFKTYTVFRLPNVNKVTYKKSIIIPAKNEEGNLLKLVERLPKSDEYEIIFSCGVSKDQTFKVANEIKLNYKNLDIKVIEQSGTGKSNAVWEALTLSSGDLIAILDADLSVSPEEIPNFFKIIENNQGDFVNGTRLIYQMEKGAMRTINKIGNRIFQRIIGVIISMPLTDSLCGTKVFRRDLLNKIIWWQNSFNLHDPFGDFDLIFSAAITGEKIVEYPIHYKTRTYGRTQISRFKDGFKLIRYLLASAVIFNSSK